MVLEHVLLCMSQGGIRGKMDVKAGLCVMVGMSSIATDCLVCLNDGALAIVKDDVIDVRTRLYMSGLYVRVDVVGCLVWVTGKDRSGMDKLVRGRDLHGILCWLYPKVGKLAGHVKGCRGRGKVEIRNCSGMRSKGFFF